MSQMEKTNHVADQSGFELDYVYVHKLILATCIGHSSHGG